jgi:hypothetical protein
MTVPLTRDTLAAAYDYLRSTPPFRSWNLPEPEEIVFRVAKTPGLYGWCDHKRGRHVIAVSRQAVGHTMTLFETMAHEMLHLHEARAGVRSRSEHGPAFKKWSARICKVHGFDPKRF